MIAHAVTTLTANLTDTPPQRSPESSVVSFVSGCVVLLSLVVGLCAASPAFSQGRSLKDAMFGRAGDEGRNASAASETTHYTSEAGQGFVFDESQSRPLIRFDGDDEIYVLSATPGPRGDITYRNDIGEPVLKSSRWGGMTVFTRDRPTGSAAAPTGKAQAFSHDRLTPQGLFQELARASRRASQALGHLVSFEAEVETPEVDYLFAEAAEVGATALTQGALESSTRNRLGALRKVRIIEGRPPGATLTGPILTIRVDTSQPGWGARPSSKGVLRILTATTIAEGRK